MSEFLRVTLRDGKSVVFEAAADEERGVRQVGRRDLQIRDLSTSFEDRLSGIRDAASAALSELRGKLEPDEIRLKFGIKMSGTVGVVIAQTALEGNFDVEMVWKSGSEFSGHAEVSDDVGSAGLRAQAGADADGGPGTSAQ